MAAPDRQQARRIVLESLERSVGPRIPPDFDFASGLDDESEIPEACGLDSLDFWEFQLELEERMGVTLPEEGPPLRSLGALCDYLVSARAG